MEDANKFEAKVVLLGETGIGKTSIALQFVKNHFYPNIPPTVGASYLSRTETIDGNRLTLQIWDTAGYLFFTFIYAIVIHMFINLPDLLSSQERFRALAPMYYRGAEAAIIAYDIASLTSFEKAKDWLNEVVCAIDDELVLAVVGNKLDLADARQVDTAAGLAFAQSVNAIFAEVSAKTGEGIFEMFFEVSKRLLVKKLGKLSDTSLSATAMLTQFDKERNKNSCCR